MVYCAAYGCTNVHTKGCGKSFFNFPKDARRRKIWTIFCKRESFVPTTNHRLCSDHFTKNQLQRDPAHLERLGYEGARTRLKVDAVPDVPLPIHAKENNGAVQLVLPAKPRGAYAKRQKAEVCNPFYYYYYYYYLYTKNIMFILISTQNNQTTL